MQSILDGCTVRLLDIPLRAVGGTEGTSGEYPKGCQCITNLL